MGTNSQKYLEADVSVVSAKMESSSEGCWQ